MHSTWNGLGLFFFHVILVYTNIRVLRLRWFFSTVVKKQFAGRRTAIIEVDKNGARVGEYENTHWTGSKGAFFYTRSWCEFRNSFFKRCAKLRFPSANHCCCVPINTKIVLAVEKRIISTTEVNIPSNYWCRLNLRRIKFIYFFFFVIFIIILTIYVNISTVSTIDGEIHKRTWLV